MIIPLRIAGPSDHCVTLQALADPEEAVIGEALAFLTSVTEKGMLQRRSIITVAAKASSFSFCLHLGYIKSMNTYVVNKISVHEQSCILVKQAASYQENANREDELDRYERLGVNRRHLLCHM